MVESTGGSMSKCKKRNATRTNIVSYPASSLVYEVTQKEYEAELERSSKLDNKVGIALAFFGVFSAYIIKFFDFSVLLNFETYPRSCLHIIKCITIFAQITIIFTYVITLILLFLTAKATKYMHFDCKYFIGDEQLYKSKSVSNVQTKVAMRYIGAIIKNTATNDTKAKNFNRAIFSLGVLILFCIVAEILRINFFNLGVG